MLVHKEKERFRLEGLGRAWRHITMDAVTASQLMAQMVRIIDHGFTDGEIGNWETFKFLRGEDYHPDEIFELFRLKRELQLSVEDPKPGRESLQKMDRILIEMEKSLKP
jgi:hypothetical protein